MRISFGRKMISEMPMPDECGTAADTVFRRRFDVYRRRSMSMVVQLKQFIPQIFGINQRWSGQLKNCTGTRNTTTLFDSIAFRYCKTNDNGHGPIKSTICNDYTGESEKVFFVQCDRFMLTVLVKYLFQ